MDSEAMKTSYERQSLGLDVVWYLDFDQFKLAGLCVFRKIFTSFEHRVVVGSVVPIDLDGQTRCRFSSKNSKKSKKNFAEELLK